MADGRHVERYYIFGYNSTLFVRFPRKKDTKSVHNDG